MKQNFCYLKTMNYYLENLKYLQMLKETTLKNWTYIMYNDTNIWDKCL